MKTLHISVDFDGCIVSSRYPHIGVLMDGAKRTINKWAYDHTIIVNTCRAGKQLQECKDFLVENGIRYHYLNENDPALIAKYGRDTRKISADVYVDDRNIGGFCGWKKADDYVRFKANQKPVVLCIVGESGSGKTTLAEYIESNFGVKMIQSYTTRPKRTPSENGHTFVTDQWFDALEKQDMIAFTQFGDYRYCCLKSDVEMENTYVIDEFGYKYLLENFADYYDIHAIRVRCNKTEREERAGKERVQRDEGKFVLPAHWFGLHWNTDSWRDNSLNRQKDYENLHNFINQILNRGWQ